MAEPVSFSGIEGLFRENRIDENIPLGAWKLVEKESVCDLLQGATARVIET